MNFKQVLSIVGGSIVGLVIAISLPTLFEGSMRPPKEAKLVSDLNGAVTEVSIHYKKEFHGACIETLQDFFSAMPEDVEICVAVEKQEEFDFLKKELSNIKHGPMKAVVTGYPITPWSKDRYGTLATADGDKILALPPVESPAPGPRGNDGRVPGTLAKQFKHIDTRRMSFFFEGGDLLCADNMAYIAATCLSRNQPFDVDDREGLIARMTSGLGRDITVIGNHHEEVPDHHIGMYLTPLGNKVVAVADPDLGLKLYRANDDNSVSIETDTKKFEPFRNVIRIMEEKGFTVIRIPMILTSSPRVYVTYNNAILETRAGEKRIYMPVYDIPHMDKAATSVFEAQGFKVIPIRVKKVYGYTGSLRCLIGIMGRKDH